ncbi:MAG: HAD-IIIA family hydrolase [Proteobacteria bacterium]|uniref:3-deoxy-D-manno-octulosonate 8-phosphate phosphatase KdsC n=1 Tax=SAR92 bacterium BACL26 MAG-121220-bin70 TaxID=1655626 RepID=A0A0R2UC16_9GAMM|nr:MAG: 3-deoxy-D-manno-octulosonate 8-phosphate phosphatase [SAR92 bacterium BACL26 MAG-121220-bin70]MDA0795293.1 HAD-IIIA family hydrolase [Pseudomonadota bacterium]MDA1351435.1 HAD-IIIA family hydrolase [Pseudomonadota bacterium]
MPYKSIRSAAKKIKLLLLDVDGVLTDGRLYYGNSGEEMKAFNIQDGLGIKLLQQAGIQVGIITGRVSELVQRRATELGINPVIQGREDKLTALNELMLTADLSLDEVAFVGDDLPDLAVIKKVGLGITVANGSTTLKSAADWQTTKKGGDGAVREVAEMLLTCQDNLAHLLEQYQ